MMKIGLITHSTFSSSDSLNSVFGMAADVAGQDHEIIYCPPEYAHSSRAGQQKILGEFLSAADVILGPIDETVMQARERLNKHVPYICYLLGSMSRGAPNLIRTYQHLKTTDILVGNCSGDLEIARRFFSNAQTRLLPFSVDESIYYPMDAAARLAIRTSLGFGANERILLYSGRVTLEKNVHTLLRVFSAVEKIMPDARLIIAGSDQDVPFAEFGVFTLGIRKTLGKVIEKLEIPKDKVLLAGQKKPDDLRELYNAADLVVNLTLHHDENFGLAQLEAMACGTPVIGTNWGGLKDTISEGETGYKISTSVTSSGVKVNWWEAVNKIVSLLKDRSEYERLSSVCQSVAVDKYSKARYRERLESILSDAIEQMHQPGVRLRTSAFGWKYWSLCAPKWGERPPYQRSPHSYQLYRELISPFAGEVAASSAATAERAGPADVLVLAAPAVLKDNELIAINDPIFPFEVVVPQGYREAVRILLDAMADEPVTTFDRLLRSAQPQLSEAIKWMIDSGLLLKSGSRPGELSPNEISSKLGVPLFSIENVNHAADAVVLR